MKQFLFLLLLFPLICRAQDGPYKYWKIDNKAITFDAVYDEPGKDAKQLKAELLSFIPTVKGVSDVHENSTGLTAKMEGYESDFRNMGYTRLGAPVYVVQKKFGNISVQVKDGKYRVVISNIICDKRLPDDPDATILSNAEIELLLLKGNKSGWATAKGKVEANKKLEEDFYKSFKLKPNSSDW